jgi:hypothetical protein
LTDASGHRLAICLDRARETAPAACGIRSPTAPSAWHTRRRGGVFHGFIATPVSDATDAEKATSDELTTEG